MLAPWYQPENHPHFAQPPVIETAMALEFPPIPGLDLYRLMKLQGLWEDAYPRVSDVPGAPPTPMGDEASQPMFFIGEAPKRVWAAGETNGLLIQTQADRLILNWRKGESEGPYPGYHQFLRAEYLQLWALFRQEVESRELSTPIPTLAEFTYVNWVPMAPNERPADILTILNEPSNPLPGQARQARFEHLRSITASESDPFTGQLRIVGETQAPSPAERRLMFTVTAQVLLDMSKGDAIDAIDAAHGLGSYTFSQIITSSKQAEWERLPS